MSDRQWAAMMMGDERKMGRGVGVGLMMLEPHMSGTILILAGAAAVLFAAGIKLYWFAGGGAALMGLVVLMMSGYQSTRILVWQDPWAYPRDGGYQIIQSLYAIGSGGLLGLGLGKSLLISGKLFFRQLSVFDFLRCFVTGGLCRFHCTLFFLNSCLKLRHCILRCLQTFHSCLQLTDSSLELRNLFLELCKLCLNSLLPLLYLGDSGIQFLLILFKFCFSIGKLFFAVFKLFFSGIKFFLAGIVFFLTVVILIPALIQFLLSCSNLSLTVGNLLTCGCDLRSSVSYLLFCIGQFFFAIFEFLTCVGKLLFAIFVFFFAVS